MVKTKKYMEKMLKLRSSGEIDREIIDALINDFVEYNSMVLGDCTESIVRAEYFGYSEAMAEILKLLENIILKTNKAAVGRLERCDED